MEFSRQEHWSGKPIPSPEALPHPGIEPGSPTLQVDSLPAELPGKPHLYIPPGPLPTNMENLLTSVYVPTCTTFSKLQGKIW